MACESSSGKILLGKCCGGAQPSDFRNGRVDVQILHIMRSDDTTTLTSGAMAAQWQAANDFANSRQDQGLPALGLMYQYNLRYEKTEPPPWNDHSYIPTAQDILNRELTPVQCTTNPPYVPASIIEARHSVSGFRLGEIKARCGCVKIEWTPPVTNDEVRVQQVSFAAPSLYGGNCYSPFQNYTVDGEVSVNFVSGAEIIYDAPDPPISLKQFYSGIILGCFPSQSCVTGYGYRTRSATLEAAISAAP